MTSNVVGFSQAVLALAANYLLHSTLLLGSVWLVLRLWRPSSHTPAERLWKLAAALGLIAAPLQLVFGTTQPWVQVFITEAKQAEHSASGPAIPVPNPRRGGLGLGTGPSLDKGRSITKESKESYEAEFERRPEGRDPLRHQVARGRSFETSTGDGVVVTYRTSDSAALDPILLPRVPDGVPSLSPPTVRPAKHSQPSVTGTRVLSGVAFAGAIAIVGFVLYGITLMAFQSLALRRRFAEAELCSTGPARCLLDRFLKRQGIRRRVRLLSAEVCSDPVTFGLFRWTIVLPEKTEERLAKEELKALLAHEVAHLVRGDVLWLWLGRFLCTCLAFQPLNFLARRRWQQASEYSCDDWAMQRGVRGVWLARCLTRIAEWRLGPVPSASSLAATGSKGTLVDRVERLVRDEPSEDAWTKPARQRSFRLLALFAAAAFIGYAPRVVFPLAANADTRSAVGSYSRPPAVPQEPSPGVSDWESLQDELQQLDADLARADALLRLFPQDHIVRQSAENLRRRMAELRQRRQQIAASFEKESK